MSLSVQKLVGWTELSAGIALTLGLFSRLAALAIIPIQVGAIVLVTQKRAMAGPSFERWGVDFMKVGPEFNGILIYHVFVRDSSGQWPDFAGPLSPVSHGPQEGGCRAGVRRRERLSSVRPGSCVSPWLCEPRRHTSSRGRLFHPAADLGSSAAVRARGAAILLDDLCDGRGRTTRGPGLTAVETSGAAVLLDDLCNRRGPTTRGPSLTAVETSGAAVANEAALAWREATTRALGTAGGRLEGGLRRCGVRRCLALNQKRAGQQDGDSDQQGSDALTEHGFFSGLDSTGIRDFHGDGAHRHHRTTTRRPEKLVQQVQTQ